MKDYNQQDFVDKHRQNEYFTLSEARAKQNKKIRSRVEFSGVPKGTTGKVTGMYSCRVGTYGIDVTWDLPRERPLIDGFSKRDYELLEEI